MDEKTTTDASGNKDGNPGCTFRDLVAVCPEYAERGGWEGLQPCEWVEILSGHPEFADRCDWAKLDGEDWVNLLTARPGFADKCDWESIAKPLDDFCGELWPDFFHRVPSSRTGVRRSTSPWPGFRRRPSWACFRKTAARLSGARIPTSRRFRHRTGPNC